MEPVYNLKARPRLYRCDCCGHEHKINTNHTGPCVSECPKCSWRGGKDSKGQWYNAMEKNRPHYYAGGSVQPDEINPHARGEQPGALQKFTIVCLDHDEVEVTLHAEGSDAKGAAQGLCRENDFIKEVLVVFPGHLEPENACSWLYEDLV